LRIISYKLFVTDRAKFLKQRSVLKVHNMYWGRIYQLRGLIVFLPLSLAAMALFFWLSWGIFPAVPTKIAITAGAEGGMYFAHAKSYAAAFAAHGIQATVLESEGSLQNIERLREAGGSTQVAFVQGGVGQLFRAQGSSKQASIQTIANVEVEPIWIFTRDRNIDSLEQLKGLRVSIDKSGSGTRLVAVKLLEQVNLQLKDLIESDASLAGAVKAFSEGRLDAVVFVASPNAPAVIAMLNASNAHLMNFKRAGALIERIPYLESHLVPQGMLNSKGSQPPQDMAMLTTIASVVVREDLHPAIKRIIAQIARQVHGGAGIFHKEGDFPSLRRLDFSSASEARLTLARGLPWIDANVGVVPAQWARRLVIIGITVALLCWALCTLARLFMYWTLESQINRWYGELKFIENDLTNSPAPSLDTTRHGTQLRAIETALKNFEAPPILMRRLFMLKRHVDFVRNKLLTLRGR
jgi:uncharacterized protein